MTDVISGNRNLYLDILKGVAVIFVVIGHCIQYGSGASHLEEGMFFSNVLFKWIYSFHMPFFALVGGYFFGCSMEKKTPGEFISGKSRSILVPVISWGMLNAVMGIVSAGTSESAFYYIKYVIRTMVNSLWFLWVVLYASIIMAAICYLFRDSILAYLCVMSLSMLLPDGYHLGYLKFLFPFFAVGYFCRKRLAGIRNCLRGAKAG